MGGGGGVPARPSLLSAAAPARPDRPTDRPTNTTTPHTRITTTQPHHHTPPLHPHSGILSEIIVPKYDVCNYSAVSGLRLVRTIDVAYDGRRVRTAIWSGVVEGLPVTFVEPDNGFFWRKQ